MSDTQESGPPASEPTRLTAEQKRQRMVETMRSIVARHGTARATFDEVAREAGVSRGLLHYHFGSKERLLIEVVKTEADRAMGLIREAARHAHTVDDVVELLVSQLKQRLEFDPEPFLLAFEMVGEARANPELGAALAAHERRMRMEFGALLAEVGAAAGFKLRHPPAATASALLVVANGLALEILEDPDGDHAAATAAVADIVRFLLGGSS